MIEVKATVEKVNHIKEEIDHREMIEIMEMISRNRIKDLTKIKDSKSPKDKEVNYSYLAINKTSMNKLSGMYYQQNTEFYQANIQ
jgi:hypothetical protein